MTSRRVVDQTMGASIRTRMGVGLLTKLGFQGANLADIWNNLLATVTRDPHDAAALLDLSTLAQLLGQAQTGQDLQDRALSLETIYRSPCKVTPPRVRLLAIAASTDIGGNIPLDFLLAESDVELLTMYVSPDLPFPETLPDHDLAIVAMGNADGIATTLALTAQAVASWPRPVLNEPARILHLERDHLYRLVQSVPGLECPMTVRVTRSDLELIVSGTRALASVLADGTFPIIIRPVDSHAGKGLEKADTPAALSTYLGERAEEDFFISRFVDYSDADGLFRKYRIVFIDGVPFAAHMAISDQWKIWYYNALMEQSEDKRAEEAQFMEQFDEVYAARHRETFKDFTDRVGLAYFGIDCAETKDGKLLLFEGETALIVHDMDPPEVYPYKAPQMRKLFAAFVAMLHRRAGRTLIAAA